MPPTSLKPATEAEASDSARGDAFSADRFCEGAVFGLQGSAAWFGAALLTAILAALYYKILLKLISDWYHIPDYSHGMLIPFFVCFLLWDKREILSRTKIAPSWMGLTAVVAGIVTLLLGVFGADLFLSRASFILVLAGVVWTLMGARFLLETRFLLFVLLLAVPLPALLLNHVTFPLQLLASRCAGAILPLAGIPVLQEGNIIQLPAMRLEVAEACSGIRSLMSLLTVAVLYGYLAERGTLRRVVLALTSIPIAVAANTARIVGTGVCVQYWDAERALGFFHEFSGWLMFVVSLFLLYVVHMTMQRFSSDAKA